MNTDNREVVNMTKAKAIKELVKLGWTLVDGRKGQSSVKLLSPDGREVVANAQDLLIEVRQ